jgi:oxygen-dependent protoporphyrinogen oxidase
MKKVVVIGGGLSGLSAARAVKEAAASAQIDVSVTLLEKDGAVGGKIRSAREEGFVCEYGPNGFLDNKPSTMALTAKMGIKDRILRSNDSARKRYIFTGKRMQQLPEDPMNFLMSEVLSIRGKMRLAADFFLPQGEVGKDETVAEFVRRRLGEEALDKLIDPMSAGIYAGDPSVMSIKSCFPKVKAIEDQFGGLLRGMLAMQQMAKARGQEGPQGAGPGGVLWSFATGTGELCELLAKELGGSIMTGVSAAALERGERDWKVRTGDGRALDADEVVLAAPAYDGANLLRPHSPEIASIMSNIPYVPMAVLCIGFDKQGFGNPLDGFGFLIPKKEGRKILGSLWSSSIFKGRAPDGKVLITVMMGGARNPEVTLLDDDALLNLCRCEVKATMGVSSEPCFVKIFRWKKAIPQYLVGHSERVEKIECALGCLPGLHLGGNAYYGIGINDCTARSEILGKKVLTSLCERG